MLKKIFSALFSIVLLVSCSGNSYGWKNVTSDVESLKNIGFNTVYRENNDANIKEATAEYVNEGLEVLVINIIGINNINYDTVNFEQFENSNQAQDVYNYYVRSLSDDRLIKFCLKDDILISCNSTEAMNLLGYNFK